MREELGASLSLPVGIGASHLPLAGGSASFVNAAETEPNNTFGSANAISLGFEVGKDVAVSVSGTLVPGDYDFFRVELEPGDVIGANVSGSGDKLKFFDGSGLELMGSSQNATFVHPAMSPLVNEGNTALSWVVSTAGTYYVSVNGSIGAYNLELELFRPKLENEPIEIHQVFYLDFDGATIDGSIFGSSVGMTTLSPLSTFLPAWGLDPIADLDAVIDAIVENFEESISTDVRLFGNNGDYGATGLPGDFDIEIRNSRDHADPWGMPHVSRVIVGGTIGELEIATIAIAESIDVGNFATAETAVILLDLLSAAATNVNSLNRFPLAPSISIIDLVGVGVGNIAAHEAGHLLGNWHTNQFNQLPNIMDQGGNLANSIGLVGAVWGDGNELDVDFGHDIFVPNEGFTGVEDTLNTIAFGSSSGTADTALTGPIVVTTAPLSGPNSDVMVTQITVQFSEQLAVAPAEDSASYQLLEAGENGVFEAGGGDDVVVPVVPTVGGSQTIVTLLVDPALSPLGFGSYQLTIDGDDSIVDLDGNPLNSKTGVGGGFDYVLEFDVVFVLPKGGDLYSFDLVAGDLLNAWTEVPFDDLASSPENSLNPALLVLGPNGLPIASDL